MCKTGNVPDCMNVYREIPLLFRSSCYCVFENRCPQSVHSPWFLWRSTLLFLPGCHPHLILTDARKEAKTRTRDYRTRRVGMSVQIPISPISRADSLSPTSTTDRDSRRSLILMANNLKPTRRKLQKYFSRPMRPAPEPDCKEWNANDVSSAIKMASMQMGSLGNPKLPISPVVGDSRYKPALARVGTEQRLQHKPDPTPEVESIRFESRLAPPKTAPPPPQHSPPPQPLAATSVGAALPSPQRLPPPPPPPQVVPLPLILDATSRETDPMESRVRRGSSLMKSRPVSGVRRRAKTPVHKIGQLELAAAKKRQEAAINRQSSVRSIARQYRTLIEEMDVPTVHRKPLPATAAADPDALRAIQRSFANEGAQSESESEYGDE